LRGNDDFVDMVVNPLFAVSSYKSGARQSGGRQSGVRQSGARLGSEGLRSVTRTKSDLASIVMDCLYEVSGALPSEFESSHHFFEYGVDFTLLVDLVVALEDRLNIAIPNEVFDRVTCVDDMVRYLYLQTVTLRERLEMQAPANETSLEREPTLLPTQRETHALRQAPRWRRSPSAG
jgi:acyl carrier protein